MPTRIAASVCLLACLALAPRPAYAYFERLFVSSRAFSLGGAYVSIADEPSATVINPAGLTQLQTASFLSSFSRPYDLAELEEHFLAAAVPTRVGTFGLSWHRFGLDGVTSEDLFTVAYGVDYIRNSQDASLSFGGSIDVARVSYQTGYDDAKTVVSGSVSVLLRPFPVFGVGYTIRNLGQPEFDWIPQDGSTRLQATQAVGLSYYWERYAVLVVERSLGQNGVWSDKLGIEVNAVDQLSIRGGMNAGDVTGGLGVTLKPITIDAGVTSHRVMGLTYYITIGFSVPQKQEDGYPDVP